MKYSFRHLSTLNYCCHSFLSSILNRIVCVSNWICKTLQQNQLYFGNSSSGWLRTAATVQNNVSITLSALHSSWEKKQTLMIHKRLFKCKNFKQVFRIRHPHQIRLLNSCENRINIYKKKLRDFKSLFRLKPSNKISKFYIFFFIFLSIGLSYRSNPAIYYTYIYTFTSI